MAGINKCIFVGNLAADPELKEIGSTQVVNFRIGVNRSYQKDGERQQETEWVSVVSFGKTAEFVGKYLTKGRLVYVEGRLQTRSWEDKDSGEKKYRTEIVANDVQGLDKAPDRELVGAGAGSSSVGDVDMPF